MIVEDDEKLCRELRKVTELPVIVITSQDTQMAELMSLNQGADDFYGGSFGYLSWE